MFKASDIQDYFRSHAHHIPLHTARLTQGLKYTKSFMSILTTSQLLSDLLFKCIKCGVYEGPISTHVCDD